MDRQTGEMLKHRVQRVQVGSDPVTGIFDIIMMPLKDRQTSRKHLQKKKKGGRERGKRRQMEREEKEGERGLGHNVPSSMSLFPFQMQSIIKKGSFSTTLMID